MFASPHHAVGQLRVCIATLCLPKGFQSCTTTPPRSLMRRWYTRTTCWDMPAPKTIHSTRPCGCRSCVDSGREPQQKSGGDDGDANTKQLIWRCSIQNDKHMESCSGHNTVPETKLNRTLRYLFCQSPGLQPDLHHYIDAACLN